MLEQNRSILYADDTVEQRYAMRRILESAGYSVLEAGTGAETLALLRPGLAAIVLDVKLPDMSGYDVCRRIREMRPDIEIPIIQVSASFADPSLRAQALSAGADAYIAQPVHPPELVNLLQALIVSYQSRRTIRFLAGVGPRISGSLDLHETLRSVVSSVVPVFCDRCYISFAEPNDYSDEFAASSPPLQTLMSEVNLSGRTEMLQLIEPACSLIAAPLAAGPGTFGSVLFVLDHSGRIYTDDDRTIAEDLAARFALSLQNSQLHTSQQVAQAALIQAEKIAAAGRMSAAIAHEINNPLEAVINLIYLIETSPDISEAVRRFAQEALSELSRLSHITRQTLGFYRELVGPQSFDVAESIEGILELLNRRLASKNIRVEKDLAPGLQMHAVQGEIRQVLSNLILNALDAMDDGGLLRLQTECLSDGGFVIRIIDNGKGIPPQLLERIFEPFFTTKNGIGTGLGLWVSSKIIQKHGGRFRVRSSTSGPDRGTTMELVLGPKRP